MCATKQRRLLAGKSGTRQQGCTHGGGPVARLAALPGARLRLSTTWPVRSGTEALGLCFVGRDGQTKQDDEATNGAVFQVASQQNLRGYSGPLRPGTWS